MSTEIEVTDQMKEVAGRIYAQRQKVDLVYYMLKVIEKDEFDLAIEWFARDKHIEIPEVLMNASQSISKDRLCEVLTNLLNESTRQMVLYSEQLQTLLKDQLAKIVLATSQDISEVNSIVMNRLNAKFTAHEAPGLVISPVDFGEVSFEVVQVREYTLSVLDFTKHLSHKDIEESLRRNAKMHANEWWDTPDRYQALLSASNDLIDSAKALLSRYCEIKDEPKDPSEDAEMNAIRKKFYYSANTLYRIKCELMNRIASEKSPIMQKELSKIYAELEAIHSNTLQKIAVEVGKVETNIREEHATSRIFPMIFGERNIKKQIALSLGKARAILGSDGPKQLLDIPSKSHTEYNIAIGINVGGLLNNLKDHLRRGGYGKNIFDPDQEFRAIDRLQKLIEQCGENFPTPMQIAYELYRTGWTDNGRKQLFNYLVNVGVISQDIYKAGLDLIATDGMALYDQGLIEPVEGDLEEFDEIDENPEVLPDCFGETEKFERPEDEAEQQGFVDAPVGTAVLQRH